MQGTGLLFFALLVVLCGWVLMLPLFPSQDGAAHKFYAWVVERVLAGDPWIRQAYELRHPIPPYASQHLILVGLARLMSLDKADEVFVCTVIICTALGVRLCCTRLGPGGAYASLFVFPMLLSWSLLMGFMNYSLGVGLMLLIYACWMRAADARGWWAAFTVLAVLLAFTHPLALLMALALCLFDFATQLGDRVWQGRRPSLRELAPQMAGLALLVCEMGFPLLHTDAKRTGSGLLDSMFRFKAYLTDLTLDGVSPYARHSTAPLLLLYKVLLYAVLLGGCWQAAKGLRARWQARELGRSDYLLGGAILLYATLPLTPDWINGAALGSRLLIFTWFGVVLAASRAELSARQKRWAAPAAFAAFALTLLCANTYIRPAALELSAVERMALPQHQYGLVLLDGPGDTVQRNLQFNPMLWAPMLAMMRAEDIPVNSPWLDQIYYIVKPGDDPHLLFNMLPTPQLKHKVDMNDGSLKFLSLDQQQKVLKASAFLVVEGAHPAGTTMVAESPAIQSGRLVCGATEDTLRLCLKK